MLPPRLSAGRRWYALHARPLMSSPCAHPAVPRPGFSCVRRGLRQGCRRLRLPGRRDYHRPGRVDRVRAPARRGAGAAPRRRPTWSPLARCLYFEPRLSKSQKISCNTCHDLAKYGVDNEPTPTGTRAEGRPQLAHGVQRRRRTSSVWDVARRMSRPSQGPGAEPGGNGHAGRARGGEGARVDAGVRGPVRARLSGRQEAGRYDNMAKAIGAFERKLMTPSRWTST